MTPHPVTNERIAEIRTIYVEHYVGYSPHWAHIRDLLARHDADNERIKALEAALRRLVTAEEASSRKFTEKEIEEIEAAMEQAEEALKGTMSDQSTPPANPNVTREGIEVKPGQVWQDLDKRMPSRTRTVLAVENGKAIMGLGMGMTGNSGRTKVSVSRMHKSSTGWRLVS